MKFIHIGDVHLGMSFKSASFGKTFGPKKREAIKENLMNVLRSSKTKEVDVVLISGDFLEGDYVEYKDIQDVRYLFEQMGSTKVVIIAGNHDPLTQNNPYDLVQWPKNVTILGPNIECVDFEEFGTSIAGYSWNSKGPLTFDPTRLNAYVASMTQPIKIVLLHGDCYQDSGYMYMNPKDLEKIPCSYIGLGHIHKPDLVRPWIAYSGSLEPLDFSENYEHGFMEGTIIGGGDSFTKPTLDLRFIPSMVQPMYQEDFDLTGYHSNLQVYEGIMHFLTLRPYPSNTFLRINLIGQKEAQLDFDYDLLSQRLKQGVSKQLTKQLESIIYVEINDKSEDGYDLDQLYRNHENDVIGYFIRKMREENDPKALRVGLSFLLKGID